MTGYSGTPLANKLGIKENWELFLVDAPAVYLELIEPLPPSVTFVSRPGASTDMVHVFATRRTPLGKALAQYRRELSAQAVVWVSWPKKASKVPSEITEDTVRELALPLGFVDIKVCAVNEVWSGLKLVVRKELR